MMFALYFDGDIDASLAVGEAALRINPNDGELMGEYGYRLALAGRWAEGCALVEEARARNPGPLGYFEGALALCAYFADDHERAAMWVRRTRLPANPNYHLIAAVVFAEAGLSEDAAAEIDWLRRNAAGVLADARGVVASRVARPEDVERLLASLRKAEGSFDALQWPEPGDRQP
jgi:tetratricopeptide (TPR) repeat protein